MVNRHDMNSAGGAELLALRREPAKEAKDARVADLQDKIAAADDLNIRLAAHIIDLNGKIVELEAKLKMQGEIVKAEMPWRNLDAEVAEKKAKRQREAAELQRIDRVVAMNAGPIGGYASFSEFLYADDGPKIGGLLQAQPQRRAHRIGPHDDCCQECGIAAIDIAANMRELDGTRTSQCKGYRVIPVRAKHGA